MKDLKFEQKRSLSRIEAADQLAALADALRKGGDAELELGDVTLSLRIPDDLRSEVEVEVGSGEVELEIELKWPTTRPRTATRPAAAAEEAPKPRKSTPAKPRRTGTARTAAAKRPAVKSP
ncbi:amphi-Trp domain-containing protein [Streptomyces sp. NRRL S-87]|uniref:amphi-Trp domain-containing protein n=1 Tax=Streptomyces sp. NRRL S-87 TaxID=1463920 RepID=UPI0004C1FD39|nr:amphi-Trp domain-containing protein [Streptomyces sp. NRRL S-87]